MERPSREGEIHCAECMKLDVPGSRSRGCGGSIVGAIMATRRSKGASGRGAAAAERVFPCVSADSAGKNN